MCWVQEVSSVALGCRVGKVGPAFGAAPWLPLGFLGWVESGCAFVSIALGWAGYIQSIALVG